MMGQHRHSTGPTSFVSSLKTSAKRITSIKSMPPQLDGVFESIDEGYPPSFSTKRSSNSSRSSQLSHYKKRAASESNASIASQSQAPDRKPTQSRLSKNPLSKAASLSSWKPLSNQQSLHGFVPPASGVSTYVDIENSTSSLTMAETASANGYRQEYGKSPSTSASNVSFWVRREQWAIASTRSPAYWRNAESGHYIPADTRHVHEENIYTRLPEEGSRRPCLLVQYAPFQQVGSGENALLRAKKACSKSHQLPPAWTFSPQYSRLEFCNPARISSCAQLPPERIRVIPAGPSARRRLCFLAFPGTHTVNVQARNCS
ncbi:hypothetical protein ABVK25_008217 [Lepraria finkii]|uniref:Uncharacterized protein n=1 Tax=Lepraria finkii TaxID=1340010 RepID=A0ABR4B1U6_9LECA